MDSDSDIIYDSEPDRARRSETSSRPVTTRIATTRNHLRRTSDERPGLSSEGSTAELERQRGRRKQKVEPASEVLILDSGSEEETRPSPAAGSTTSKYFSSASPPKRRRCSRSPSLSGPRDPSSPEGWPFSAETRIGSRSPPLASRRASTRSHSTSFSATSSPAESAAPRNPVASTSRLPPAEKASPPFTSALDLLNARPRLSLDHLERSSSPDATTAEEPTRSKTTSISGSSRSDSKAPPPSKSKALKETPSASSIEIVAPDKQETGKKESGRSKQKSREDQKEKKEEEEMSEDLPDPAIWAQQFALRDKKGTKGKNIVGLSASGVTPSQEGKRKKPWEALEAKAGTQTARQKRTAAISKKSSKKVSTKKVEEEKDESLRVSDEDDDIQVVTSTALKPCPSGRLSHLSGTIASSSTSTFTKKKPASRQKTKEADEVDLEKQDSTLFDAPPPLVLPVDDRIRCLSHCPLCAFASSHSRPRTSIDSWSTKSLAARQSHLRQCSKSHDYTSETVSHLVNQQILVLSTESEAKRLERDLEKSLFDRAIGKGEGVGGKEVTVVGIEGIGAIEGDEDWCKDVKGVQEQVDGWRKKGKRGGIEERLARNAKEIKRELEMAAREKLDGIEMQGKLEEEDGYRDDMPRATGRLRPETESDRDEVSRRAKELLQLANGTQLTRREVLVVDGDSSMDVQDRDHDDQYLPPPSTQPFEDSTLAERCHHDGAINIVRPLALSPVSKKKKLGSRSPLQQIELAFSSDEEGDSRPKTSSLWNANAGDDQASLSRVVQPRSAPFGTPIRPLRTSSPVVSPSSALNPHLSTLTLSSSSSTSSLPNPSTLMRFGSSRGVATFSRESQSPNQSPTRRPIGRPRGNSILLARGNEELEDKVEKLGCEGSREGRDDDEVLWMDEGEDEWVKSGAMLVGGVREGRGDSELVAGGGAESSEEEPLANLVARTPSKSTRKKSSAVAATSKAKTTSRRRISPSSPSGSPTDTDAAPSGTAASKALTAARTTDPPGMPAYSSLPLSTLQKEVQKYGYRPSKEKSVVVQQLRDVWRAINKDAVEAWERGEVREVGKKGKGKGKGKKADAVGEAVSPKKTTQGRRKRRVIVAEAEEEESDEGETRTVGERLRELIVNDEALYLRILRYEPIHLDEFILLAANNKVKVARQLLIRCLDEQSITFYQEDPTNGQRKRHK